jgi:hypothetical protein
LSLSGLPTREWRSLHRGGLYAGKAVKITKGVPHYYSTASEAIGHNKRGFCPHCGSRLFGGITASTLDDPSLFHPQFDIFTSDAQPWDHMDPKLPKFEKYQGGT